MVISESSKPTGFSTGYLQCMLALLEKICDSFKNSPSLHILSQGLEDQSMLTVPDCIDDSIQNVSHLLA